MLEREVFDIKPDSGIECIFRDTKVWYVCGKTQLSELTHEVPCRDMVQKRLYLANQKQLHKHVRWVRQHH